MANPPAYGVRTSQSGMSAVSSLGRKGPPVAPLGPPHASLLHAYPVRTTQPATSLNGISCENRVGATLCLSPTAVVPGSTNGRLPACKLSLQLPLGLKPVQLILAGQAPFLRPDLSCTLCDLLICGHPGPRARRCLRGLRHGRTRRRSGCGPRRDSSCDCSSSSF